MNTFGTTYQAPSTGDHAIDRDARALLGQVMGYVAVTVAFAALGAYLGRDLSGATGLVLFIGALGVILALSGAVARGREQLALGLLFGLGLLLGLAVAPVIADYAMTDPSALWQAAGVTAAFVAGFGAYGYATRRDLSSWARPLFWALLGLIVFGIAAFLVSIPNANVIYAVAGLVILGAYTVLDFNRLRRSRADAAVLIASSILLDIFNVFLLVLELFGGRPRLATPTARPARGRAVRVGSALAGRGGVLPARAQHRRCLGHAHVIAPQPEQHDGEGQGH